MSEPRSGKGFTIVEGVIIFIGLSLVVGLGVTFFNAATKKSASTQSSQNVSQDSQLAIPTVNSTKDLDAVSGDLDKIDVSSDDEATQLDAQQAAF